MKALLYSIQVFYSFFIMYVSSADQGRVQEFAERIRLLFMTYNLWIMLAVAAGAFIGYMIFGGSSATKTVACH